MHRKQTFEIVFEFKSDTAVLTFTFRFLSSLLFSLFLPHVFFFAEYLVGFISVGKFLRKLLGKVGGYWNKIFMLSSLCLNFS